MLPFRFDLLFSMFVASATIAYAAEFPTAPPKQKDAETQGLYRMSTAELKEFLPGKIDSKGVTGKHMKIFKPDGSVYRTGFRAKEGTGTWRFDEKNNAYCNAFIEKKGYQEGCFAVFRAPDGAHYFDYEIDTGFYAHAWRRATEE
ncbi:MAG: hypothetical protein Q8L71_04920 [Thiobacillus sp.]|nr:hypothetical protein [Thiobacillus sp.]